MSVAGSCVRCGAAAAAPVALTTVRAAGPWSRRDIDDRPRCAPCARGPGLRALAVTACCGWWGWPGLRQAPGALLATARDLARLGAFPRPLAATLGVAGHLVPLAVLVLVLAAVAGPSGGARAAVAEAERLKAEGAGLLARGQPEAALARFREALAATPGVPALCFEAGRAAERAGRRAEAERHYRDALHQLAPERDARFDVALGDLLLADGRAAEAATHLERALATGTDALDVHRALQDALRRAGRGAEVESRWTAYRRAHPRSADAHYLHARALDGPAERAALLRAGLTLDPDHYWCHLALGDTLLELGDPAGARAAFGQAAARDRGALKARFGLLRAEVAAGDRAAAATTLDALRRDFPGAAALAEAERLLAAAPPEGR